MEFFFKFIKNLTSQFSVNITSSTNNIQTSSGLVNSIILDSRNIISLISLNNTWIIIEKNNLDIINSRSLISSSFNQPNGNPFVTFSPSNDGKIFSIFSFPVIFSPKPRLFNITIQNVTGSGFICYFSIIRNTGTGNGLLGAKIFEIEITAPANGSKSFSSDVLLNDIIDYDYALLFNKGTMAGNNKIGISSFSIY